MDAVVVRNLSKTFRSKGRVSNALKDVSLSIREGEIFGLLGPNGAGKTTLISILIGLVSRDGGVADIFGMDIEKRRQDVQKVVNMVRGFSGVIEKFTVREMLTYYAMLYDVPKARVDEVIARVGLKEKEHEESGLLSSGWRQRLFIAKALLNSPKVLFLDEPTVGLDVDAAIAMRRLIKELNSQGHTILLTTHYMQEAEELCNRIALISDGGIVAQGTAAELKLQVKRDEAIIIKASLDAGVRQRLSKLEGVLGVAIHAGSVRVLVSNKRVMRPVLRFLSGENAHVEAVTMEEPTLEDVFLKFTKKGLEADDE
jgi:ABC-2 type transport system ATP-binding protein